MICRIRGDSAAVPLVRARDSHEHVWLPAAPLLFQRRHGAEHHAISGATVSTLLDEALARTGLVDQDGTPLRCTPHDFRRMFITDAIRSGLPPHIAQIVAGHRNINVTMGYNAVYPDDAIQAHLAFLARRRALRPTEEYRMPTDEEWQEFLGHFERRKVSIGTLRALLRFTVYPRARLCPLLHALARPLSTAPADRDPRQPRRPHRRSTPARLARRGRRTPSQPRRGRGETRGRSTAEQLKTFLSNSAATD